MYEKEQLLADRVEQALCKEIASMTAKGRKLLPQQKDLAEQYNVSLRTIRTVVNRLKERNIIHSIKGKGMFIKSLSGESGNVLLVADDFSHPYVSMVVSTAASVLISQGLTPVMVSCNDLAQSSKDACGILVIRATPGTEKVILETGLPCCAINDVFTGEHQQPIWMQTVRGNNYLAGYLATEFLLRQNKKQIIYFGYSRQQPHVNGYIDALKDYGAIFSESNIIIEANINDTQNYDGIKKYITTKIAEYPSVGFINCYSSVMSQESTLFHMIMEGVFSREDSVVVTSDELNYNYMANTKIVMRITPLVERAIDIIMGRSEPFAICETHDQLKISVLENNKYKSYDIKEYFSRK